MKNNILQRISINSKKIEVVQTTTLAFNFQTMEQAIKNTNLLVDEYNFLRRETIKNLFRMDWKSISMVGGMNL